ncbi:MAG: AAA family ATPase [Polyangiaceae bacterium]|nr:AAA family ATPase [Polyangiaceae bacterium]
MKILSLELLRWGPFSDLHLDFSSPPRALHLVVGSNEAGKSTTLRAVTGLFFGIPERTTDDHRHKKDDLRLGGRIASEDGAELVFVRRKGRKNTLKDAQGESIDEERLRRFVGNIEQSQFETMFGLSHDRLVQGGRALVQGKGDLGESLFGAGLGQTGLSSILNKLKQRADDIFVPRGRVKKLNHVIENWKAARKIQQETSQSIRAWEEFNKERSALEQRRTALVTELDTLGREQRRLSRVKRALRPIAERGEILAALELRRDDVVLPDSAAEDRRAAEKVIREAHPRQEQLEAEIAEIEAKVASLSVPEKLLDKATSVRQLAEDLGSYRKAMAEAAQLNTAMRHIEDEIRTMCKRLRRDEAEFMRGNDAGAVLPVALEKRVRGLIKQRVEVDARIREATKTCHVAEERLAAERHRGEALPAAVSLDRLAMALEAARREGDLDKRIRERAKEADQLGSRVRARYASLELYGFPFDRIGTLPMPSRETIERFERELTSTDDELRNIDRVLNERQRSLAKMAGDIAVATRGGEVPTASDLEAARTARNAAWVAVRRVLFGQAPAESHESVAAFRAPPVMYGIEALSEYEAAVRRADDIADRLFREADRVARIAELSLQKNVLEREMAELERSRTALCQKREDAWSRWLDAWKPSGVKPLSPAEMKDFLGVYDRLADEAFRWRETEMALEADRNRATDHAEALASLLADAAPSEGLARLIERAAAACEREERAQKEREAHARDMQRAVSVLEEARRVLEREKGELLHWASVWEKALVDMGLPIETGHAEAEEVLGVLSELGKRVQDAQDKRRRLSNIEREAQAFTERTLEIAQLPKDALNGTAIEQIAAAVVDDFRAAERDDVARRGLLGQLEDKRRELSDIGLRRRAAESEIESLRMAARVNSAADLPMAEERSKEVRDLRSRLETVERQLLDFGEGIGIDALVLECHGLSGDDVAEALKLVQERIAATNENKATIEQEMGRLAERLASVDGSARAAEAAEEAEQHLAAMAVLVEEYARAKLAHRLLEDEIKQYREKNQGPIIRRASELFERLTLGSFVGVRGDNEGDEGKPILECVRPGGVHVTVDGLSDGTRDQLFFALRIASLERYFEHNEPIPFILDDILVNFDDARSRASLEVLGELSRRTQVLFFTHHARVAELARDAVPSGGLCLHDLDELSKTARVRPTES